MAVGNPASLGTSFSAVGVTSFGITPSSNLTTGQVLYLWTLTQSTVTPVTGSGGAGTWVTDIAEFAQGTNIFSTLLRYVVPAGDNGTAPAFTFSFASSHSYAAELIGITGANQTTPTLSSNTALYNGSASPLTGPSLTPSALSCEMITFWSQAVTSVSAATSQTGWTSLPNNLQASKSILIDYKNALTTDTVTAQNDISTWTTTGQGLAAIIAVQPPPAASGVGGAGTFRRRFWRLRP